MQATGTRRAEGFTGAYLPALAGGRAAAGAAGRARRGLREAARRLDSRRAGDLAFVFNVGTGELVAGHQRMAELRAAGAKEATVLSPCGADLGSEGLAVLVHPRTGERFHLRLVRWDRDKQRVANLVANSPHVTGVFTDGALAHVDALALSLPSFEALRLEDLRVQLRADLGRDLGAAGETAGSTDPAGGEVAPATTPVARLGDLWILGDHRLVCGDSTVESVARLAIGGQDVTLLATDPPYGIGYDPSVRAGVARSDLARPLRHRARVGTPRTGAGEQGVLQPREARPGSALPDRDADLRAARCGRRHAPDATPEVHGRRAQGAVRVPARLRPDRILRAAGGAPRALGPAADDARGRRGPEEGAVVTALAAELRGLMVDAMRRAPGDRPALLLSAGLDSGSVLAAAVAAGHPPAAIFTATFGEYGGPDLRGALARAAALAPDVPHVVLASPRGEPAARRVLEAIRLIRCARKAAVEVYVLLAPALDALAGRYDVAWNAMAGGCWWGVDGREARKRSEGEAAWRAFRRYQFQWDRGGYPPTACHLLARRARDLGLRWWDSWCTPAVRRWMDARSWDDLNRPRPKALALLAFPELARTPTCGGPAQVLAGVREHMALLARERGHSSAIAWYNATARAEGLSPNGDAAGLAAWGGLDDLAPEAWEDSWLDREEARP